MMENTSITFKVVGDETHYSCGCRSKVVGTNFLIKPCALDCEVYQFSLEESKKKGNDVYLHVERCPL